MYGTVFMHLHQVAMLKMQIASLLCTQESSISLIFKGTQKQIGSSECGLYAIAFATALMFGQQPGAFFFDEKSLRKHLVDCFQKQRMSIFPYTRTRRNASKVRLWNIFQFTVCAGCLNLKVQVPSGSNVQIAVNGFTAGNV